MKPVIKYILIVAIPCFLLRCTGTKRLPEGEKLYTGSDIKFFKGSNHKDQNLKQSLKELLHPEPNAAFLGMRPRLWIYNRVGEVKKKKGLKYWLKNKIGEPPVLFSDVNVGNVTDQMQNRVINKGYFNGKVNPEIETEKDRVSVIYHVSPGKPFSIRNLQYPDSTSHLKAIIAGQKKYSLLKKGHLFDLETMANERKRIEKILLDSGYFHFSNALLTYDADSTVGNHQVDITLRLKKNLPSNALQRYRVNRIAIIPGYATDTSGLRNPVIIDSMHYYLDPDEIRVRPVANNIRLHVGRYYSREDENITLNRLAGLNVFRYININYSEDSVHHYLHTAINLVPYKRKSIRLQLNAISESNNFVGPFFTLSILNRNFLGGGEQLQVSLNSGFETQINANQQRPLNSYELGLNASLSVPLLVIPFRINESDSKYDFKTEYEVGIRSQRRVGFFNLMSLDLRTGYLWNKNVRHRFEVFPVNVNFFRLSNTSARFRDLLESNPYLQNAYQEQFILGGRYSYFYNSRSKDNQSHKTNSFYFNANINTSGNILHVIQNTLTVGGEGKSNVVYKVGGLPYAQFSKVDLDMRYYHEIDFRNRLATRLITGVGYAYGNSSNLPYTHQFAIGGASSIRAFRPRSVGPGAYAVPDSLFTGNDFIDQTADIKLEANIEYRFDLYKNFKGAVFVDAGNIWSINKEENRPGGQFLFNRFYKEIAVGAGVGLRYDFNFLILRLDVATPLHVPYGPENERWVIDNIAIDKKSWRKKNMILNFAIGYPF